MITPSTGKASSREKQAMGDESVTNFDNSPNYYSMLKLLNLHDFTNLEKIVVINLSFRVSSTVFYRKKIEKH